MTYRCRNADSDSVNLGSNPGPPATLKYRHFRHFRALLRAPTNATNQNRRRTSDAQESAQSAVVLAAAIFLLTILLPAPALAAHHRHHAAHAHHRHVHQTHVSDGRPRAWCGWYARHLVGSDPGPAFNLARNWARWGRPSGPGVGVMVVWSHHVGQITGRTPDGQWIIKSGNDGHGVRERPRSIVGAIAFRSM